MSEEKYGIREMYQFYKKECNVKNSPNWFVDYKSFAGIIYDFNKELARLLIEEGIEFKMPQRLGFMRIRKWKLKNYMNPDGTINKRKLPVDWKRTKELWKEIYPNKTPEQLKAIPKKKVIYHLNEHTDGYRYRLYWSKKGSNAKNRKVYSLVFTFTNHRHLARVLKSNHKPEYYE